jgi:hypothetical protein
MTKYLVFSPICFIAAVGLLCVTLASCQTQETMPTTAPTLPVPIATTIPPSPTSIPPTVIPPTPKPSPTPVPSIQVQSLQDIVGDWKSPGTLCAGNPCLLRFKADGTFEIDSLFQGVIDKVIESGKITVSDGIFHLETTGGECAGTTNGYYQIFLTNRDGKPYSLQFTPTQSDECADREKGLSFTYTFLNP